MRAWQALVAIAGLFGLSSGYDYKCYSIQNQCGTGIYVAFGYTRASDRWQTRAWWNVGGGLEKRYCFIRGSYFYAYFDWEGGRWGQYQSDLYYLGDPAEFCLSQKITEITEFTSNLTKFTDDLTGLTARTCEGLGIGATMRQFTVIDDGNYNQANIPTWACPSFSPESPGDDPGLGVITQPFNANSTSLENIINATHPFAVFGYHPGKGWSVEEPQSAPDQKDESSDEPLLP